MNSCCVILPLEASQRTEKGEEFLRILWNPFVKISFFFNGRDLSEFPKMGFAGKVRERAWLRLQEIGTEWGRKRAENEVVEAITVRGEG